MELTLSHAVHRVANERVTLSGRLKMVMLWQIIVVETLCAVQHVRAAVIEKQLDAAH
jgi:hypothetical protein